MAFESKVTLRIYSKSHTLGHIKTMLGQPTEGCSIGDIYGKKKKSREHTYWGLSSKISKEKPCGDHIKDILKFVEENSDSIKKIQELGCEIDLSCFLDSDNSQGGFTLDQTIYKKLLSAGLPISFDFYAD